MLRTIELLRALRVVKRFSDVNARVIMVGVYLAAVSNYSFADQIKTAPTKGFYDTTFQSNNPAEVVARYCPEHGGEVEEVNPKVSMTFRCYQQFANGDLYLPSGLGAYRGRQYAEVCEQGWGAHLVPGTNEVEYCWKDDTSHVPGRPEMCSAEIGNPILVTSRRKIQREVDYMGAGNYPLKFERVYSSGRNGVPGTIPTTTEYKTWYHNYDKALAGDLQPGTPIRKLSV